MATPDWMTLVVAVIAATTMLGVARMTWAREREARRADHESERLAELLDAALDLRDVVVAFRSERDATAAVATYDRHYAAFLARCEAVRSPRVRELARGWALVVSDVRIGDGRAELAAWRSLMVGLGQARRRSV